ncbi:unnamed protein product [Ilex paraguariensis]|uniref:DUF4378 domain-containing protein n=1 Tax=Ilex paraguariensis TaxID=185542 RepID=A0ABC8R3C5_9AQUA
MRAEKQSTKGGGGYVGGIFQLFDWNAKSRKKLVFSKSNLPAQLKQKKRSDENLPTTQLHLVMDDDELVAGSSFKGSSDYSCASSVTDEEIPCTKAPGVVARLMGLDSLPKPNFSEPYRTPFFDSQSLPDAHYYRKNLEFHHGHQSGQSGCLPNKPDAPGRNTIKPKPQKTISRPIEKFQTESLPPKSAKSIPITHHKLLSPIKSSGFVPATNAAHIMESAAIIIELGHQKTTKAKRPLVGSSSVPLRVKDLKEKVDAVQKPSKLAEASRRPADFNAVKYLKGQSRNQSVNGSIDPTFQVSSNRETCSSGLKNKERSISLALQAKVNVQKREGLNTSGTVDFNAVKYLKGQSRNQSVNGSIDPTFQVSSNRETCSSGLKNKERSISLALQAKVNVQKREGLNTSGTRNLFCHQELNEVMSSQLFKSQQNTQKNSHGKPSTHYTSSVLRQNNQKQNCLTDRGTLSSKPLACNSQGRKTSSGDFAFRRHKSSSKSAGNTKIISRKSGLEVIDGLQEVSCSNRTSGTQKKRSIDGDFHLEKSRDVDNILIDKNRKPTKTDELLDWAEASKKKGMDVVSFTFTAPMTRSVPGPGTCREVVEKSNDFCSDYRSKKLLLNSDVTSSPMFSRGYNLIGGDALSTLLEQKLRELAHGVESSSPKASALSSQNSIPADKLVATTPELHDKWSQYRVHTDKFSGQFGPRIPSSRPQEPKENHMPLGVEEFEESSSKDSNARKLLESRYPSPISVLECSFYAESCNSSDTADTTSTEGSRQCTSVQAQEVVDLSSSRKFHLIKADSELSDSASSVPALAVAGRHATVFPVKDSLGSIKWELEYVKEILSSVALIFTDFALGRAREIVNPHLFHHLERRKVVLDSNGNMPKLRRKVLFDCVSECLDIRCGRYVGGGWRTQAKGLSVVRRKEKLAEEVYKEISWWEGMGNCMVDELVDKDMSSHYGRWLDFEVEAFELGVEIEGLHVDEVVEKGMSSLYGRWLDFEVEVFELGVEIEGQTLNSLLDEVVADILPLEQLDCQDCMVDEVVDKCLSIGTRGGD